MDNTKFYFPDTDPNMITQVTGNGQKGIRERIYPYVKRWRVCIDVGANVGMWTRFLQHRFEHVHCFEPNPIFTRCWHQNIHTQSNATLYEVGLSKHEHRSYFPNHKPQNLSRAYHDDTQCDIQCHTLDSYQFVDVDLIKIDVDGYEDLVLLGAEATVTHNLPVINIEMKTSRRPKIAQEARRTLIEWGYQRRERNKSDEIWTHPSA